MKKIHFKTKGFTLVELMIVVVVIGIISSIAYPSYQDSVRKSKRAEAKAALLQVSAEFERCFTMNGQYTTVAGGKTCPAVSAGGVLSTASTPKGYYNLAATVLTTTTFTVTATPTFTDTCTFGITHTGVKTPTPTATNSCW